MIRWSGWLTLRWMPASHWTFRVLGRRLGWHALVLDVGRLSVTVWRGGSARSLFRVVGS